MVNHIKVNPLTRIEGHLKFETQIENGIVTQARCSADLFRGIEKALIGYDARAAQQITERICGICPYAHAEAASLALEDAMGIKPNENGQLLRNLIVGAYQLHDHLMHFYLLSVLDFIDITSVVAYRGEDEELNQLKAWVQSELKSGKIFPAAPFLPRYQNAYLKHKGAHISTVSNYLEAIKIMAKLHKAVAVFGGKAPHPVTIEAGGVTTTPTLIKIAQYQGHLEDARTFIKKHYLPDAIALSKEFKGYFKLGRGYGDYLAYPYFPDERGEEHLFTGGVVINGRYSAVDLDKIFEDTRYSYYKDKPDANVKPLSSTLLTPLDYEEYQKEQKKANGKYSWARAARYDGRVMEVGPVARIITTYQSGKRPKLNALVDSINKELGIGIADYNSVMGRHLCRAIISSVIVDRLAEDLAKVTPGVSAFVECDIPKNARGLGITEATRGALSHWIETDENGLVKNYEIIAPTTWNIAPRDAKGTPGAVENMLLGTKVADIDNPIELARIVRSTDPCLACSVH